MSGLQGNIASTRVVLSYARGDDEPFVKRLHRASSSSHNKLFRSNQIWLHWGSFRTNHQQLELVVSLQSVGAEPDVRTCMRHGCSRLLLSNVEVIAP